MKFIQTLMVALIVMFNTVANANDKIDAIQYIEGNWSLVANFFEDGKWGTPRAPVHAVAKKTLGAPSFV